MSVGVRTVTISAFAHEPFGGGHRAVREGVSLKWSNDYERNTGWRIGVAG